MLNWPTPGQVKSTANFPWLVSFFQFELYNNSQAARLNSRPLDWGVAGCSCSLVNGNYLCQQNMTLFSFAFANFGALANRDPALRLTNGTNAEIS